MNPLDIHPGRCVKLPPAFCGPIGRYLLISSYGGRVIVDSDQPFDKRLKSTHRCRIADVNGPMVLTVPIVKPRLMRSAHWTDIIVSGHDNWPRLMVTALESAYGRTPYYEFYADRFTPLILNAVGRRLVDLDADLETLCLSIVNPAGSGVISDSMPVDSVGEGSASIIPYWQVRAHKLGFIPSLSILDLIFNLGPESPLHLQKMQNPAPASKPCVG